MTDKELVQQLIKDKTPAEVLKLLNDTSVESLQSEEDTKKHPLSTFELSKEDWRTMKAHLIDGGGVFDDRNLRGTLLSALNSDDQTTFWPAFVHLFKSWMKQKGSILPIPGAPGAVAMGPFPGRTPSGITLANQPKPPKE